jgi:acyl carrier protein
MSSLTEPTAAGLETVIGRVMTVWRLVFDEYDMVIGPDDDFFALGASSLLALRLVDHLGREFGVELDLLGVIEEPTPKCQAERVKQAVDRARDREEGEL